jgi:hypothetical protein
MFLTSLRCKYSPKHHVVKCVPLLRSSLTTTNNKGHSAHKWFPTRWTQDCIYVLTLIHGGSASQQSHPLVNEPSLLIFHKCVFMFYPFHPPWLNHCNNNWWKMQITSSTLHYVFIYYYLLCLPSTYFFIICSHIPNLCPSIRQKDQVQCLTIITWKITFWYVLNNLHVYASLWRAY